MLRAGTGDRAACQRLVERHLGRVVTFAHRTLGNRSDAEDAAQDVFLRVWAAAPRWKPGPARFTTWLYRVAMNVCLDRIAKKREATERRAARGRRRPRPSRAPRCAARRSARHVGAALAALPETQRIAVTLCHYQGLRNVEAAEVMGVSVEALESLLARGRRAMRAPPAPRRAGAVGERLMARAHPGQLERLEQLLDAYGAAPERWPDAEREAARAAGRGVGGGARALWDEAAELDRLLDAVPPSRRRRALAARVLAAAPRRRPTRAWRRRSPWPCRSPPRPRSRSGSLSERSRAAHRRRIRRRRSATYASPTDVLLGPTASTCTPPCRRSAAPTRRSAART